jgi:uncharacterized protein
MDNLIITKKENMINLLKKHKIVKAYVFGSVTTSNFNENSDIDFLISFQQGLDPLEKGELWWSLHDSLRELFNREIDLITENTLKNPYFIEEINNTKQLIYGQ